MSSESCVGDEDLRSRKPSGERRAVPSSNQVGTIQLDNGCSDSAGAAAELDFVMRNLRQLPKAELHTHMIGAMRKATMIELAEAEGIEVADPEGFANFDEFQQCFQSSFRLCVARPENMQRLVREVVEDAATDGVVWVQPHFNPHPFGMLGDPDSVMKLVLDEGRSAGANLGVGFGLTMAASRHAEPAVAEGLAEYAAGYVGMGVHAFGLTGNEQAAPAVDFARAFAIAVEAGLTSAPHAGEMAGPASVRSAVEALGATRIAHGIRAVESPELLELLVARGVSLDVCISSNLRLGVVDSVAEHPLPRLVEAGVNCSLGADDPLMFGVGLNDEYDLARRDLGLTDEQLAAIARTSLVTSDAPKSIVAHGCSGVDDWLTKG